MRSGRIEERLPTGATNSVGAKQILAMGALDVPFGGRVSRARCDIVTVDRGLFGRAPRAIQLMFRRHRDCTPMEYLRRVRLHHAHQELLAAERAHTTVAQIAASWGFAHTGRFAVYYRQVYGQSPHSTLRD